MSDRSSSSKVIYFILVTFIFMSILTVYWFWLWRTGPALPELVTAKPMYFRQDLPVRAALLWREEIVKSPVGGVVQYRNGGLPHVIAKGDLLSNIMTSGKKKSVYSRFKGYFVPGLDGLEGKWRYSDLWRGSDRLPKTPDVVFVADLNEIGRDRVLGKIIPQPQDLRCILYCPATDVIKEDLSRGSIEFRLNETGAPFKAQVRVYEPMGHTFKLYLTLPFFPISLVLNREIDLLINGGDYSGAVVPESSVIIKNGKRGLYIVKKSEAFFKTVDGMAIAGGRFFVKTGIKPGDLVIVNGISANEGRIRLW